MPLKTVQFLAVLLTALALVPAGAHLAALPNKLGLAQDPYFITQSIYRGWALSGIVWLGALVANLALAMMLRGRGAPFVLALIGCLGIAAAFAVFFAWTYPANQATDNWTTIPANWRDLRLQWEYSHAANAGLILISLCAVTLAVIASSPTSE